MSQAFYTSMSGISSAQTELSVVANNIANMNTTAYKSSHVNFQDIFYNTLKYGSEGGTESNIGGTNPQQVGVGVKVESINKNFTQGTWTSTGINTDLYLNGSGYFTLINSSGGLEYTRDGSFSLDSKGNLVTANGAKVAGTSTSFGIVASTEPVRVPTNLYVQYGANNTETIATKNLSELNGREVSTSKFYADITYKDTTGVEKTIKDVAVDVTSGSNMGQISAKIQEALRGAADDGSGGTLFDKTKITVACNQNTSGTMQIIAEDGITISFKANSDAGEIGSLAFVQSTGLDQVSSVAGKTVYATDILDYQVNIDNVANGGGESINYQSLAIQDDGSLEVTYSNGDKISVYTDESTGESKFKYTTANNVVIKGADVKMPERIATTANFQIQLANFTNEQGLILSGNNTYTAGASAGNAYFGTVSSNAFGTITTGGLEGSNVDLAAEFSGMILAQRAIQANSRVFSTASSIMETISYLGQ